MEYLVGVALALMVIYLVVQYIIIPVGSVVLPISLVVSFGFALIISAQSFFTSLSTHINPYTTYVDKSPKAPTGVNRNYFFGPGYHQIAVTISDAFKLLRQHLTPLKTWVDKHSKWFWIVYGVVAFCAYGLGFIWIAIFSTLLSTVLITGMTVFYVFFTFLWAADRLGLTLQAIQSRCPNCKRISVVPIFVCPACGLEHKRLIPGPYGVMIRKCRCGERLSTTYFTGRSTYTAVCPFCTEELAASDAQQFGIQLIGGVSTGKTTFLAAFWHEYLLRVRRMPGLSVTTAPADAFDQLEYWFQHGDSASTTETNAKMYSLIHQYHDGMPIQMTIYDIAGEAFSALANDIQQQQFQYCEGIAFVIDPTAGPLDASETISSFVDEFIRLRGSRAVQSSDIPVAVMITKADLYRRRIGLPKIRITFASEAQNYADEEGSTSLELVRNGICRDFLVDHGFTNAVNLIEAAFSRVQYYPVSAMGHNASVGYRYEPWGVLEPIAWLLRQQKGEVFENIVSSL